MSTKLVYEVVYYDARSAGPAGDHTHVFRTTSKKEAQKFAAQNTCYGQPAKVQEDRVSLELFRRWQREGKI